MQNHHTHTTRCGHAVGSEREYIETALAKGLTTLGFSDHSPWPSLHSPTIRMDADELPGYVHAVRQLQKEYRGRILIKCGLECEYFPYALGWLREQKETLGLDYLIFGNHFDRDERTGMYFGASRTKDDVRRYLDTTLEGMQTGLYILLAHPDLFLRAYQQFDDVCRDASREICRMARALQMPLEYNLLGLRARGTPRFSGLGYPYHAFWEIAAEEGCDAIINFDAHDPVQMMTLRYREEAVQTLKALGIRMVELDGDNNIVPAEQEQLQQEPDTI